MTKQYRIGIAASGSLTEPSEDENENLSLNYFVATFDAERKIHEKKRFGSVAEALNFIIDDCWVKRKEGFELEPCAHINELPYHEHDLVRKVAAAYCALEQVNNAAKQVTRTITRDPTVD